MIMADDARFSDHRLDGWLAVWLCGWEQCKQAGRQVGELGMPSAPIGYRN